MPWDLSRLDWEGRIQAGLSLMPDLPFLDRARGGQAVKVFNSLRLSDVPGLPLLETAAGDWQREIVEALEGSLIEGERLIRELFLLVPKKNSKSSGSAAMMLTALLLNRRPRAVFILVAPTIAVADIAFRAVQGMIDADPYLKGVEGIKGRMHVQPHVRLVTDRTNNATLQVRSFDAEVLTGVIPSGVLLDEVHLMSRIRGAASIIGQIRGGLISQPEAFFAMITTQSDEPPAGAFAAELRKARLIRDGKIAGAMLPILYEFPPSFMQGEQDHEPWRDPKHWWMVTPNRGRSIRIERLVEEYQTALDTSEDEVRRWASQHLNIEIGLALRSDRWAGADFWLRRAEPELTLKSIIAASEVCTVGMDGGGLDDLFSLTVLGREPMRGRWLHWSHSWAHKIVLDRRKSEAARLMDFVAAGELTIVDDLEQAFASAAELAKEVKTAGKLGMVGLDRIGVGSTIDHLAAADIAGDGMVVGVDQGFRLNGAIKTVEVMLSSGKMVHAGQKIMAWAVGNARTVQAGNAVSITKQASGVAKIDPLMSLFDAVACMSMNPEVEGPSVLEERGPRFL